MSCTREEYVKQLQAWVGLKESNGSHKKIIDIYNTIKPLPVGYKLKYTDAWCAGTVSAAAQECGATDIFPTECSCPRMIEKAKKMGIWVEADNHVPLPGDLVLYDWDDSGKGDNKGNPDHVGGAEKIVGSDITVIEGNYSNAVKRRTLKVNGKYIRGYIVPNYDKSSNKPNEGATGTGDTAEPAKPAELEVDGLWGMGTTKRLQQIFGTPVDGVVSNQWAAYKEGNPGLVSGWDWKKKPNGKGSALIKAMQKWAGMAANKRDGEIGPETIKAIQKKLGTPVDGKVSEPSQMVKALQKWANNQ